MDFEIVGHFQKLICLGWRKEGGGGGVLFKFLVD